MSELSPIPPPPTEGYVGVLTETQTKALASFRTGVTAKDSSVTQGDDHEACRFLRSERWDVTKAVNKYVNYLVWRRDNNIAQYRTNPHPEAPIYERVVPHAIHGFDKAGRPMYIEKSGQTDANLMCDLFKDVDATYLVHVAMQERVIQLCEESSLKHGRHIETFTTILDLKGTNSSHRKALKFVTKCAGNDQNLYPERMGSVFIINAPWIFPVLWNIVKVVLDANTRSKIHVIKGDYKAYLRQHIDADQLPNEYGGDCKCCSKAPNCIPVDDCKDLKANIGREDDSLDLERKNIAAGKTFVHQVPALTGAILGWYSKVSGKDIGFSVEWIPQGKEEEWKNKKPTERNWVEPYARRITEDGPIEGQYTATEPCTVVFTWDNSYSYWSSKDIAFSVTEAVIDAEDEKATAPPVDRVISGDNTEQKQAATTADTATGTGKPRSDSVDSDAGQINFHGDS